MIGAYRASAVTLYRMGDFELSRRYAMRGIEIWRSGGVQTHVEDVNAPAVICLCFEAQLKWHFGEIAFSQIAIAEAISLAKELNDKHALTVALYCAAVLGHFETDMTAPVKNTPLYQEVITRTPAGRWGSADECAGAAIFLASRASDFVTGTTVVVDGGYAVR
jgi:hypothetical protein